MPVKCRPDIKPLAWLIWVGLLLLVISIDFTRYSNSINQGCRWRILLLISGFGLRLGWMLEMISTWALKDAIQRSLWHCTTSLCSTLLGCFLALTRIRVVQCGQYVPIDLLMVGAGFVFRGWFFVVNLGFLSFVL